MTKIEELEKNSRGEGCLGRSKDDEPIFILCARDDSAPELVREWAGNYVQRTQRRPGSFNAAKHAEALALANKMDAWRAEEDKRLLAAGR